MLALVSSHLGIPTRDATVLAAPGPSPMPQSSKLLPLPVINIGLPKSASTSVLDFFQCNGMKTSHHDCEANCTGTRKGHEFCGDSEKAGKCGECVYDNIHDGQPPFEGCGDYDVWAQFDGSWNVEKEAACFLPQITELHALHAAYPGATFVMATRKPDIWVKSVAAMPKLRDAFRACKFTACQADCVADDKQFAAFYDEHTRTIRQWVEKHPSHKLIEIDADGDIADNSRLVADATGLSGSCWGPKKCSASCEFWQEVKISRLQDAADAAAAALDHERQVTKDAKCKDETCAKDHRIIEQKMLSASEHAAEELRQAEDQIHARDAEKERLKEVEKLENDRAAEAEATAKRQEIDNTKLGGGEAASTPANTHDPNVVCIPLEGYDESWCYAACPTGVCPSDAKKGCMCAAGNGVGGDGDQQQQGTTDWATGKKLPSSIGATNTACVAIKSGYSDFWCQTSCASTVAAACPESLCSCEEGAVQKAKAAKAKAMEDWEEAQRKHLDAEGAASQATQPKPVVPAVPAAPGPATPEQTAAAAEAWAAAAAAPAPEAVTAQPAAAAAAAAAPVAAQSAATAAPEDDQAATAAAAVAWAAAAAAPAPVAVSAEPAVATATTVAATATAAAAAAAAPATLAGFEILNSQ